MGRHRSLCDFTVKFYANLEALMINDDVTLSLLLPASGLFKHISFNPF